MELWDSGTFGLWAVGTMGPWEPGATGQIWGNSGTSLDYGAIMGPFWDTLYGFLGLSTILGLWDDGNIMGARLGLRDYGITLGQVFA